MSADVRQGYMWVTRRGSIRLVLMLLAVPGCDFLYGVNRHTLIAAPPDFACVEKVIRRAPGVDHVRYSRTEGSRPLTWTGLKPPTDVHTYFYRDGEIFGALQVTIEYDGKTNFSQHLLDLNRKPPQVLIDASRPVMRWIEDHLEEECGMTGLTKAIEEWCRGVECPPLPGEPNSTVPADAAKGPPRG